MRRFTRLTQKDRYAWASKATMYRGSLWTEYKVPVSTPGRDYVNSGYWVYILGCRLVRSVVTHEDAEV